MRVVCVPSSRAEELRAALHSEGVIDRGHRITKRAGTVLVPLRAETRVDLARFGATLQEMEDLAVRPAPRDPAVALRDRLASLGVRPEAAPRKWERIGDVVVLRIPESGRDRAGVIADAFARVLGVDTVVEDVSGVHGPMRTPEIRLLRGTRTETVHLEGGVRYRLDVARIMFSSGNLPERLAIADRVRPDDVVVDLFAGIGYFTLPIAVRGKAQVIHACELNPVSFGYLEANVRLNRVTNVVTHRGDCRLVAPRGGADVVLMGHFSARKYLDVAFECLRGAGRIVYHELTPKEQFPEEPLRRVSEGARAHWYEVESARARILKSYAPGIVHAVVEATVRRRPKGISGRLDVDRAVSG